MFNLFNKLSAALLNWCLSPSVQSIGEIWDTQSHYPVDIVDNSTGKLKFIRQSAPTDLFVLTPTGYQQVKHIHKTVQYAVWSLQIQDCEPLLCADTHIVMSASGVERFVKELQLDELIETKYGPKPVVSCSQSILPSSNMFDLELTDEDHVYYTNDIVSHNSETSCAYLFWFSIFNKDKTVLITSNKAKNSSEMISRIKYMYENLPDFVKPGITDDGWNKLSLRFETGSRIISDATSETTGRGGSFSILYADELGFVRPGIQSEFWASISPTLATGGKLFMTSTPNGDSDLFATLWRGAASGTNGMVPLTINWKEVPGRDEAFKKREIAKNGELKFRQEFECEFLSSDPLLVDSLKAAQLQSTEHLTQTLGLKIWKHFGEAVPDDQPAEPAVETGFHNHWHDPRRQQQVISTATYEKSCIITVDPSKGVGKDYTVVEVFSYPDMEQMMELRSNKSKSGDIYIAIKRIWEMALKARWQVFFSVENNGVGEGLLALFENDSDLPDNVELISDTGQVGLNTNVRTKALGCKIFKEFVESGKLKIKSKDLIHEIKQFVLVGGTYKAKEGSTDDCVMSTVLVCRVVKQLAAYDDDAFNMLYSAEESEESKREFLDDDEDEEFDGGDDYDEMPMVF